MLGTVDYILQEHAKGVSLEDLTKKVNELFGYLEILDTETFILNTIKEAERKLNSTKIKKVEDVQA